MRHGEARGMEYPYLLLDDDAFPILINEGARWRARLTHWLIVGDEEKASTAGACLRRIEEELKALVELRSLPDENSK